MLARLQHIFATVVVRIVIQVAHNNDFRTGFLQINGVAYRLNQHSRCVTARAGREFAAVTTRPVVNNDMYLLRTTIAHHITRHKQLQTRLYLAAIRIMGLQLMPFHATRTEHYRVIQKAHIHTTTVRTFYQNWLQPTTVFAVGFRTQVFQTTDILHLGYADTSRAARIVIRAELGNGISHILHFVLILVRGPFHTSVRQILIVVLALVMNRIKQILKVIKCHTTDILSAAFFLRQCCRAE